MDGDMFLSEEAKRKIVLLPAEAISYPLGLKLHSSTLFPFQAANGDMIHAVMIPKPIGIPPMCLLSEWGYSEGKPEQPRERPLSMYFQSLGLQLMTGPAPRRTDEKLFRFNKWKNKWLPVVGYKRMRRSCRLSKK